MVGAPPCALKRSAAAGGALLSHGAAPAVPSALAGLTSGFGMGPGVPPPPRPPAAAKRSAPLGGGAARAFPGRPGGRMAWGWGARRGRAGRAARVRAPARVSGGSPD